MNLKIVLEPAEEGGYTVYVPALPGCISEGDTKEEAINNIKEAIELYLETLTEEEIKTYLSKEILTTSLEVKVG